MQLGLMAAVTYTLGRAALVDLLTVVLALLSAIVVFFPGQLSLVSPCRGGVVGLVAQLIT